LKSAPKKISLSSLSEKEEKILRMNFGLSVQEEEFLPRKTEDPKLLEKLLELERSILARSKKK
jgi:hypothetical protein